MMYDLRAMFKSMISGWVHVWLVNVSKIFNLFHLLRSNLS